ncbi:arginase family protein [Blastococcus sp. BMG 814]|uniref:Arginase family protein n=1 Tax=Blastococcus carthaginiensis TaxID=3050034 RepID=A0ABT9IBU8_9ACTN|nr:arginase family protein [Blastococcus carthaginiensis]MDP5183038.1 arginase family protein [Blastococcus carthaginiensis]
MTLVRAPVRLLGVPYDSGHRDRRMGAGPTALAAAGAADRLRAAGHEVIDEVVEPASPWNAELRTAFELHRLVAAAATEALAVGQVPVLLAGNCNTTLGVLAALTGTARRIGLVWLDAHGDFNTPETDTSGFLDGQGLAIAVGRCWTALAAGISGFRPLPERDVLLVGARDLTEAQLQVLHDSGVTWLPPARARVLRAVEDALDALATRVDAVHFHVDLDVHDPSIAPANTYAADDGLTAEQVRAVLAATAARMPVVSGALASWDPTCDVEGRMLATALDLLEAVAGAAVPLR